MTTNSPVCAATVLLVTITSFVSAQRIVNYGQCLTPNNTQAMCVKLEHCTILYNLLLKKPLSDEDRRFLSSNGKILICCEDQYVSQQLTAISGPAAARGTLPEPRDCSYVDQDRITGGNLTKIDEFPWMALIEYERGRDTVGHHCGGSLINNRYVLTAAHCVKAMPETWRPFQVRLGEWDTSTDRDCEVDTRGYEDCSDPHVDVPIEAVITHPSYEASSKDQLYDIALLRLSHNVAYTDFIKPICLPISDQLKRASFDGKIMDIAGWGKTEEGTNSNLKLKAEVLGIPLADCQEKYAQRVHLEYSQLCAGGKKGIDSCQGDSGGPLIAVERGSSAYYIIAGVISFGTTPCGLKGWPGVYTRVSNFTDWIQETIEP